MRTPATLAQLNNLFDDEVAAWRESNVASDNLYQLFDTIFTLPTPDEAHRTAHAALHQYASVVALDVLMSTIVKTPATVDMSTVDLIFDVAHKVDITWLTHDDTRVPAYLYSVFMLVRCNGPQTAIDRCNQRLQQWLPQATALTKQASLQQIASTLFDPLWLQVYDIDFNALTWAGLAEVLLTAPKLIGQESPRHAGYVTLPAIDAA